MHLCASVVEMVTSTNNFHFFDFTLRVPCRTPCKQSVSFHERHAFLLSGFVVGQAAPSKHTMLTQEFGFFSARLHHPFFFA